MEENPASLLVWLKKYAEQEKISFNDWLIDMEKALFYGADSQISDRLNKQIISKDWIEAKPAFKGQHVNEKKRDYITWVRFLHFVYEVPLEDFHVTREQLLSPMMIKKGPNIVIERIEYLSQASHTKDYFKAHYLETFHLQLQKAKKDLLVYHYLDDFKYQDVKYWAPYYEVHRDVYQTIQDKIKKKSFEYVRFLTLPVRYSFDSFLKPHKNLDDYKTLLGVILSNCPLPLFDHIYKSNLLLEKRASNDESGFYIIIRPTRDYHWGMIDHKTIITEHCSYDGDIRKPDVLFVEYHDPMHEMYMGEKDLLMDRFPVKIYNEHIKDALKTRYNHCMELLAYLEKDRPKKEEYKTYKKETQNLEQKLNLLKEFNSSVKK